MVRNQLPAQVVNPVLVQTRMKKILDERCNFNAFRVFLVNFRAINKIVFSKQSLIHFKHVNN